MNPSDRDLLCALQDFLLTDVLQDMTVPAHHDGAQRLYSRTHVHVTRPRPQTAFFVAWRQGPENTVRDNPKAEVMVFCGLFPGRVHDLLLELLT